MCSVRIIYVTQNVLRRLPSEESPEMTGKNTESLITP